MTTVDTAVETPVDPDTRLSARVIRFLGRAPIHIVLAVIGIFWLVPTTGLFITSLLAPEDFQTQGWWQIFSEPSKLTCDNYQAVFDNSGIMD